MSEISSASPYPFGVRLALDSQTRVLGDGALYGGSPRRVLRVSSAGERAWNELVHGSVSTPAGARLARRLTDNGMLHPTSTTAALHDVTVVIPVRDRPTELDRCLAALDPELTVLVVDDASHDLAAITAVCATHRARLIIRAENGGPAAARMTALRHVVTEYVLFLDSDTVAPRDLVARLAGHFADPLVGAVAPRIRALAGSTSASRYGMGAGSLDLGERPARVAAGTRLAYVPTAALLVRRAALDGVGGFDASLRYGEDVDLVWRLDAGGWRVRYEPSVSVRHSEPDRWMPLLRRRFRYGTSAGPLARRHPGKLTPLVVHGWSGLAVLGALTRRPSLTTVALAGSTVALRGTLASAGVEASGAPREAAKAAAQSWMQLGRAATHFAAPLVVVAAWRGGRRTRSRRAALASLVLARPLVEWWSGPRTLGPLPFVVGRIADDVAYGCGVIAGCLTSRTTEPLRPVFTLRLLRIAAPALHVVPSVPGPHAVTSPPPPEKRSAHA